jgi:small-conductance mechanosensitive channel
MNIRAVTRLLVILLAVAFPAGAQERATPEAEVATAPVELDGTVLFRVRGVSSYPAEERARAIRGRLADVAADRSIAVDEVHAVEGDGAVRIVARDRIVLGVVDADATLEQVSRQELAAAHLLSVRQAIANFRTARSSAALLRSAMVTFAATAVLALTVVVLAWLWRRLHATLQRRLQSRIHSVGIQSFEVMRAERIWAALASVLALLRGIALIACAIVYLGYVLAKWPWTRGLSQHVVEFTLRPLRVIGAGLVANIPSLIFLAVLIGVVRVMLRLVRLFFEAVGRGDVTLSSFDADWAAPTYKIVRLAIVAFALVIAYPYIPGSESAAFKGVSLFIGIVFSLGSSTAISNIIAGYMMTYRRAFKVGDRVKIGEAIGDVVEMRLQVTHLRSFKNEEIVIPNSQVLAGDVVNYSSLARVDGLILHTEVGIGYETPWRQVEAMLLEAAARTPGLATEKAPFAHVKRLGDFAVTYEVNVFCAEPKAMQRLYTVLHHNILDVFNEYGVQIMTPAYEGDPPEPKVVPPKDWYTTPAAMQPELTRTRG